MTTVTSPLGSITVQNGYGGPSRTAAEIAQIKSALTLPTNTEFSGSTITETRSDGLVTTTEFEAAGTILTTYGAPISKAIRTTFNADGSITEEEV